MAESTTVGALRAVELPWLARPRAASWAADASPRQRAKRALDVALCLAALPVALLLLLVCAIAIQLESAGPTFEHERCAGRGGRAFRRYRLRTTRPAPWSPSGASTNGEAAAPAGRRPRAP
jgi:lipopolysaccharide/colanic/teichoic acid biosynthesis glycosyltransferase